MCAKNWDTQTTPQIETQLEEQLDDFFTSVQWWESDYGNDETAEGKKCKEVTAILFSKTEEIKNWIKNYVRTITLGGRQFADADHFEELLKHLVPGTNITELPNYNNISIPFNRAIKQLAFGK